MTNPYYQDKGVMIFNANYEEGDMEPSKQVKVIPVTCASPPAEVVEAIKNANKPRITIIKGHSIK